MNSANRETNEARLKEELNIALEKELDKAPDEIDVEKVDSLVKLLSRTADKEETGIRKREEFSSRFPGGYVRSKKKVYPVPAGVVRFAAAAVVFLLVFGVGNYVSVRATNRGILMNIKRQADTVLLQFIQKEEENYVNEGLQISPLSVEEKQYTGWEELITAEGLDILTPRFVPGGLELERLCVYVGDQIPWRIDARYRITEMKNSFSLSV
ncbi:MAG: hypothetical protein IJP31_06665 [Lachnospiraceae bacterium]|nr:hypothetical protein [Lachnospiraceae bacterium]